MKILFIIFTIIAIILIIAAILPKRVIITREVVVNKSASEVFEFARDLRNQEQYSVWVMLDPINKPKYSGTPGEVGFISQWDSPVKNVGKGEQEIIQIDPSKRVKVEIRFEKPFKGISYATTTVEPITDTQSKVTNSFDSTSAFPTNLFGHLMKNKLGGDMLESLMRLKSVLEK